MNFLAKLLKGIAFIPAVVSGIEGLFGARAGGDKKEAALSFASAALGVTEAVTSPPSFVSTPELACSAVCSPPRRPPICAPGRFGR